jgi:hypothetical protein
MGPGGPEDGLSAKSSQHGLGHRLPRLDDIARTQAAPVGDLRPKVALHTAELQAAYLLELVAKLGPATRRPGGKRPRRDLDILARTEC